jgi:hypothetical protein
LFRIFSGGILTELTELTEEKAGKVFLTGLTRLTGLEGRLILDRSNMKDMNEQLPEFHFLAGCLYQKSC